jgi:hypothetical protein
MKPLVFALVALSSLAAAQPAPKIPAQAKPEKPLRLNYDDPDEVEGRTARPDDVFISGRGTIKHPGLIKVRADFYREMMMWAESL